jgi:hypothetical protein
MKHLTVLSASALFGLAACNQSSRPLNSGFDPLLPPGSGHGMGQSQEGFRAGDLVRTVMDNAAFYKALPKGEADADRLLVRGTGMKVLRVNGSFVQVELDVSGEVGFVPVVMVESTNAPPPGSEQVYPPVPGGWTPTPDPTLVPPGGPIPTVIDPSLPETPVPGAVPPVPTPPAGTPVIPGTGEEPSPVPPVQPAEDAPANPGAAPAERPLDP